MLRGIRILLNLLRNLLPEPSLLREPLARKAGDRMPSYLDDAFLSADVGLARGYDAGSVAQSERMLELQLLLEQLILAFG